MAKPRITTAAVTAAHEVLDRYTVPDNYYQVSSDEQRQIRMAVVREALIAAQLADRQSPTPESHLLPPVVTGQMEIETDVTAADLGVNAEPPAPEDPREEMRTAAASIREWMPETLPANEAGQIHFARALAESAAEAIERYLATTEGSTDE